MTKEKKEIETEVQGEATAPKTAVELMLEKMQAEMEEIKAQNKMLTEIANESRKDKWAEKNLKNKIVSVVKVSTIDGKVIISWRNILDEVFKDAAGNWTEKQVNIYVTDEGEEITLSLLDAVRRIIKVEAEVLSISADQEIEGRDNTVENTYTYKVRTKEGKEITIGSKFIN